MATREIITLQFGHYSNYVGAHWWNLQELNFSYDQKNPSEINHDVLYREGITPTRITTFTPRLLLVDLKGSFGYLNQQGNLYDNPADDKSDLSTALWDENNIEVSSDKSVEKNQFIQSLDQPLGNQDENNEEKKTFDFESEVKGWVDYLVPRFHPRTVNIVKEYEHQSTDRAFDIFNYGKNVWDDRNFSDEFCDRIRQYAEECDLMQGFQVLLDSCDGFAGLGTSCIEYLRDEYGKSILAFPLIEGGPNEASAPNLIKSVNTAFSWQQLGEHASLFSPLSCGENGWPTPGSPRSFSNLLYIPELNYHTSAILATALDTLTIRYRHKQYVLSALSDLCADLNKLGRKAAATSLNLPFPMAVKKDLIDVLDDMESPLWTSLSPSCIISEDKSMHSLALRGVPHNRLKRPINEAQKQMTLPAYKCSSVHEMMTMYLAYSCHASAQYLTTVEAPLKVTVPFPKIFNDNLRENGDVDVGCTGEDVKSVPVLAGLHSGSGISQMFDSLHNQLSKIKSINKFHAFKDSGLEHDDFHECLNYLLDSKEAYEDNYV